MVRKLEDPYMPDDPPESPQLKEPFSGEREADEPVGCLLSPNTVTAILLFLTALFVVYFVILMVNPYVPINPFPPRTPFPEIVVATLDPNVPTATPTATKLPNTPGLNTLAPTVPTETPTVLVFTDTPILSPTVTQVLVAPPSTTTSTAIPQPTLTLIGDPGEGVEGQQVFTPPPPGNPAQFTRSPFPFTVYDDAVVYVTNPNERGCNWASISGAVTDLAGEPVRGLGIQLTGEGLDEVRFSGTAPTFGDGGYEFFLNGTPVRGLYTVQLLSQTGAPISEEFVVQTSPVCEENVAIVNFVQNHEF